MLYSTAEAAKMTGKSESTIKKDRKDGLLKAIQISERAFGFTKDELDRYKADTENRKRGPKPKGTTE